MKIKILSLLFFLLANNTSFSQKIIGKVLDAKTNEPLMGAAVYYDNTSIGNSTDENGEFSIPYKKQLKTPLVISFLGYHSVNISDLTNNQNLLITLNRKPESLDEIVITSKNVWSRKSMLKEFIRLYLGESKNGVSCQLLNPSDLILTYHSDKKQLRAKTKAPLRIRNVRLKYLITVDLNVFEANYWYVSKNKKRRNLNFVHYSGNNFYTSMQSKPTKNTVALRRETYKGSVLHFMRAIANENLKKEEYKILVGNIPVSPKRYIEVIKEENGFSKVRFRSPFSILYKNEYQSLVHSFVEYFSIDSFGNHAPSDLVRFGGVLGVQRMGDTLPLDYIY